MQTSSTLTGMALQIIIYIYNIHDYIYTGTNIKHTDWYSAANDYLCIHNMYNYINTGTNVKHTELFGATNDYLYT